MRRLAAEAEIGAPAEHVWELISRFEHWPRWGPSVSAVESNSASVAEGVTGRVKTVVGPWLTFRITTVDPGRSWSWSVAGIAATDHEVEALGPDRSILRMTVPWVAGPYLAVLRLAVERLRRMAEADSPR